MMDPMILYAFAAVFAGATIRTLFGWLKNGGKFNGEKFLRTVLIAFVAALMIVGSKIVQMDPYELFFSVLTLTYAVDDVKNIKKGKRIFETEE